MDIISKRMKQDDQSSPMNFSDTPRGSVVASAVPNGTPDRYDHVLPYDGTDPFAGAQCESIPIRCDSCALVVVSMCAKRLGFARSSRSSPPRPHRSAWMIASARPRCGGVSSPSAPGLICLVGIAVAG